MPEIVEGTSNSGVAPTRVVAGHQKDQLLDIDRGPRTTWPSTLAAVIFFRDQLSVPTKQSIRCHQSPDLELPFSTDRFGLDRESAALLIGKPKSLSAQLLEQRSVFLLQVLDGVPLVPIHPPSKDQHQKLKWRSVHLSEFRPTDSEEMG